MSKIKQPTAKSTGKDLVKWDEELANLAKSNTSKVQVAQGKFLSFAGGRMSFNGEAVPDDEVRCVIVGWAYHNAYYDPDARFDPKNPQTPLCYATGADEDEMAPHASAPDKQNDSCAECPLNKFGSGNGNAKACKNTIRLALIAEDDLEDIKSAEVVYASIPPKSLKSWFLYITRELRDKAKRPCWAVVTNLKRVPDNESQFRLSFTNVKLIDDSKLFSPLKELNQTTMSGIDFPYQVREAAPAGKSGSKFKSKEVEKPKKFSRR